RASLQAAEKERDRALKELGELDRNLVVKTSRGQRHQHWTIAGALIAGVVAVIALYAAGFFSGPRPAQAVAGGPSAAPVAFTGAAGVPPILEAGPPAPSSRPAVVEPPPAPSVDKVPAHGASTSAIALTPKRGSPPLASTRSSIVRESPF